MKRRIAFLCAAVAGCALADSTADKSTLRTAPAVSGGEVLMRTTAAADEDPLAAGRSAAEALKEAMGSVMPHALVMVDTYEEIAPKRLAIEGVASVFPKEIIFGGATYGMFTQKGAHDVDAVALLGIGGDGISVTAALSEKMGAAGLSLETEEQQLVKALNAGGSNLARKLPGIKDGTLLLLMADAHSPKNQFLIDGVQAVAGKRLPITGGSINKNAGQTYLYYRGHPYQDSAFGLLLSGDFKVAQTGQMAKSNEEVIATAREGAAGAMKKLQVKPFAVLSFNCGGRMGKLNRLEDELEAIQSSVGTNVPLFGCYCAGEFGPADDGEENDDTSTGRGWHVMFAVLGK